MKLGIDIQITLSVYCNIFGYLPIFYLAPSCWFVQYLFNTITNDIPISSSPIWYLVLNIRPAKQMQWDKVSMLM